MSSTSKVPSIEKYSYRSFDRMNILADARLIDRPVPSLWYSYSDKQISLASLISDPLGIGQAAMASAFVPDLNYFSGRGSKDIIPLWRDPSKTQANVTRDFLASLSAELGESIAAEDLFAYCYAILPHPAYVQTFWEELSTPGPRIPITKKSTLWDKAVELGRKLIWLHTYGEPDAHLQGVARWFGRSWGLRLDARAVAAAVAGWAQAVRRNPVRERLDELRAGWDGVARLDDWLIRYGHAEVMTDEGRDIGAYVRAVGARWLVGVVARAMAPGCKNDTMLILEGRQGARKSSAVRAIAEAIYISCLREGFTLGEGKDDLIALRGS